MRYRSCVSGLTMICSGASRCRTRPKGPWTDLTARVVAADECFTGIESHIVGTRRRLSQTRALRVLKEVAEALNSASTEQQAEIRLHEPGESPVRSPPPVIVHRRRKMFSTQPELLS